MANYLYLDGNGDYADAPQIAAYDIASEIDVIAHIRPEDYSKSQNVLGNWTRTYGLFIISPGRLQFNIYDAGHGYEGETSTDTLPYSTGEDFWIRSTFNAGEVKFYTSGDGVSWVQNGNTKTAGTSVIYTGASFNLGMSVGAQQGNLANFYCGRIYRAIIKDGISGTPVFDADFSAESPGTTSFTEDSSNAATVTLRGDAAIQSDTTTVRNNRRRIMAGRVIG